MLMQLTFHNTFARCDKSHVFIEKLFEQCGKIIIKKMEIETEKEKKDVLKILEARSTQSLSDKRSFFVCMVSDPKLFNPKIVEKERKGEMLTQDPTSPMQSWVCWPLDCLMQVGTVDEVSMRFCNLPTTSTVEMSKSDDNGVSSHTNKKQEMSKNADQ